jgi:hypothetical protein
MARPVQSPSSGDPARRIIHRRQSRGGFVRSIVLFAVWLALGACSSTYHPEYHPVTVSNVAYPVMVNNGGSASERAPTFIVASPSAARSAESIIVPAPPNEPPPGFFSHE